MKTLFLSIICLLILSSCNIIDIKGKLAKILIKEKVVEKKEKTRKPYHMSPYTLPELENQAYVGIQQFEPQRDQEWVSDCLNLNLDQRKFGCEIVAYKIQWFSGKWSSWYVPGLNDLYKKSGEPLRRYWACFNDHSFEIIYYADEKIDFGDIARIRKTEKPVAEKEKVEALRLSKESISIQNIDEKSRINLIENYSDCDRKPLELFFKSREKPSGNRFKYIGDIYREILEKYPECKLAGFIQYMLARNYASQINSTIRYLESSETAREKAIESYREVTRKYPTAEIPISEYDERFKIGLRIAPLAQLNIGDLYNSGNWVTPKKKEAIRAYELVINNYPEDVDYNGRKVAMNAYVSILNVYTDRNNKSDDKVVDTVKAKEICDTLINKFPNQGYEVEGYYFGETHPEAYMVLAGFETDKEKAIGIYEKIMSEYPDSWEGKSATCGVSLYAIEALFKIRYLLEDTQLIINYYRKILDSNLDRKIRGTAQFEIAVIYEADIKDYDQALVEYQKVLEDYGDVTTGAAVGTLGNEAESRISMIREKLNAEQKTDVESP